MGAGKSGGCGRGRALSGRVQGVSNISTVPRGMRISRAALLAGASLVALATVEGPCPAAACSGADQTISSPLFPGPIFGTGGDITIDAGASVAGGPTGVFAQDCGIAALSNSGSIGGTAAASGGRGGIGVLAASGQTVDLLTNATGARIGSGGSGPADATAGTGGAGVSIFGG